MPDNDPSILEQVQNMDPHDRNELMRKLANRYGAGRKSRNGAAPARDQRSANRTNRNPRSGKSVQHIAAEIRKTLSARERQARDAALQYAAGRGDVREVRSLLESGANPCVPSVLPSAAEGGHVQVLKILLQWGAKEWDSALSEAVKHGYVQSVKLLLEHGVRHHYRKVSLLCGAVNSSSGHAVKMELINLLLEYGSNDFDSALYAAAVRNDVEIAELMLDRGAKDLDSALRGAVDDNKLETAGLLLSRGASSRAKYYGGETLLEKAKRRGYKEMARLLRKHGAGGWFGELLSVLPV